MTCSNLLAFDPQHENIKTDEEHRTPSVISKRLSEQFRNGKIVGK